MFIILVSTRGIKTLKIRILAELFTWICSISVLLKDTIKLTCASTEEQTDNSRKGNPNNSHPHLRGHQPSKKPTCRNPEKHRDAQWQRNTNKGPPCPGASPGETYGVPGQTSPPAFKCETHPHESWGAAVQASFGLRELLLIYTYMFSHLLDIHPA